ncbi:MAG: hypothetical protein R3Y55_03830 [Rikenellaceae bacterium]
MNLQEANQWLNSPIKEAELLEIASVYYVLDLPSKKDFCDVINAVGVDKFIGTKERFDRFLKAEEELTKKEQHIKNLTRIKEIQDEKADLENKIKVYQQNTELWSKGEDDK